MSVSNAYFKYLKDHFNASANDLKSLKDFIKDIIFSINGTKNDLDLAEGTVIVY